MACRDLGEWRRKRQTPGPWRVRAPAGGATAGSTRRARLPRYGTVGDGCSAGAKLGSARTALTLTAVPGSVTPGTVAVAQP